MKVVVVSSGQLDDADAASLDAADLVIAADGGAAALDRLGRRADVLVGDLDSVDGALVERLVADGTLLERHPADKESSDTALALAAAFRGGGTSIEVLGAFGGDRIDHELANTLLLVDASLAGRNVALVRGGSRVRALRGGDTLALDGAVGDLVTLLPVGGHAVGVTTGGLRWPLSAGTLRLGASRGLSNEIVSVPASVRLDGGALLVIETAQGEERSG